VDGQMGMSVDILGSTSTDVGYLDVLTTLKETNLSALTLLCNSANFFKQLF